MICLSSAGMQILLNVCSKHATEHSLLYNANKSYYLCFKATTIIFERPTLHFGQISIPNVTDCRDLGITISVRNCNLDLKRQMSHRNPNKSKLLCYNADEAVDIPPIYLNGEVIPSVSSDKHLGNYISTNIADRNIVVNVYDLYQRSNWVISDFRVCDSSTLDSLHRTYCMHMYGCELWDLNRNYVKDFKVAWRKIKRRIWKLPYRTHNAIVHNLSYNIDFQIDTRMIKFIHSCVNHSNIVCKSIVLSKLQGVPKKERYFKHTYKI